MSVVLVCLEMYLWAFLAPRQSCVACPVAMLVCIVSLRPIRLRLFISVGQTRPVVSVCLGLYTWAFLASRHAWCFILGSHARMHGFIAHFLWWV